jgi:hypothetical protein
MDKVSGGIDRAIPEFHRSKQPFMALQICMNGTWATTWSYRLPLKENEGNERVMMREVAADLADDALDFLGEYMG